MLPSRKDRRPRTKGWRRIPTEWEWNGCQPIRVRYGGKTAGTPWSRHRLPEKVCPEAAEVGSHGYGLDEIAERAEIVRVTGVQRQASSARGRCKEEVDGTCPFALRPAATTAE